MIPFIANMSRDVEGIESPIKKITENGKYETLAINMVDVNVKSEQPGPGPEPQEIDFTEIADQFPFIDDGLDFTEIIDDPDLGQITKYTGSGTLLSDLKNIYYHNLDSEGGVDEFYAPSYKLKLIKEDGSEHWILSYNGEPTSENSWNAYHVYLDDPNKTIYRNETILELNAETGDVMMIFQEYLEEE